jgi:hypothetical protein
MSASKLTIDLGNLIMALDGHGPPGGWYLDRLTGAVAYSTRDQFAPDHPEHFDPGANAERYLRIEPLSADEALSDIRGFIDGIAVPAQRDALAGALSAANPFAAFREVVRAYPDTDEAWRQEHEGKMVKLAMQWLEDQRIAAQLS